MFRQLLFSWLMITIGMYAQEYNPPETIVITGNEFQHEAQEEQARKDFLQQYREYWQAKLAWSAPEAGSLPPSQRMQSHIQDIRRSWDESFRRPPPRQAQVGPRRSNLPAKKGKSAYHGGSGKKKKKK